MLPRRHRLNRPDDFRAVIRSGTRSGGRHVVVHASTAAGPRQVAADGAEIHQSPVGPSRVGFVVGRSVGPAVTRNRVARRLRAHLALRLPDLPGDLAIVVRALPSAADADWSDLTRDTDRCLQKALGKLGQRPGTSPRAVP